MKILGLEVDHHCFRSATVERARSGFRICSLKKTKITDPDHVKALYKAEFTKFSGRLVSGLSSKDVILKTLDLNIGTSKHIEKALLFQCEAMTHLNPSEIISIPHSIKKSAGKVQALLISASKDALKSHLEQFEALEADLDCVSFSGMAILHYTRWRAPKLLDAFIIHLGSKEWTCVLMEKHEIKKCFALGSGTTDLLTALWEDRKRNLQPKEVEEIAKQIDLLQIKPNLNPHLSAKFREMRQELSKVIFSFHRMSNQKPVVFTGDIETFGSLKEFLIEGFKEAVSVVYDENLGPDERKYAIPIGLALEQFHRPVQLLREDFFPKKTWKKAGLHAFLLVSFSVILSFLLMFLGLKNISDRKEKMIASVEALISQWDPLLKDLLYENEEMALRKWTESVDKYKKEYPCILDLPRVSEVLSWLDGHPLLNELKQEKDPFDLRDFEYKLVEYPKIGSLQNRYKAKVELQFRVKSSMNARRFHEALLQGDDLVDSSAEVTWEPLSESYRTSFYLKSLKSPYVP